MISLPHLVREVSGVPADAFTQLHTAFQRLAVEESFSENERQSLQPNKYDDSVSLLSIGHLQRFIRINKLVVTQSDIDELSGFLEDVLPSRFDEPITKPALPASIWMPGEKKRRLLIASCDELDVERGVVQDAVSSFFGTAALSPNSWSLSPLPAAHEIASATDPATKIIALAKRALENTPLFDGMQVTYEPASITMVPLKEKA